MSQSPANTPASDASSNDEFVDDQFTSDDLLDAPTAAPEPQSTAKDGGTAKQPSDAHASCGVENRRVGDYEILDEIARGGMGVVYRARQISLGRVVALKMTLGEQQPDVVRRFIAEAEAAASLDHPGIVPVFDVGRHEDQLYFTMALVEGDSLANTLRSGPMEPRLAARIARDVAKAIGYAHRQRIIHRDIKPANILIDRQGQPRITDFGVCKSMASDSELTAVGQLIGTPHYMPPEQAGGSSSASSSIANQPIGPTADIYSTGAVLYAMLTGSPPFQAANPVDVVSQLLSRDPVAPRVLNPSISRELDVIVMKCLSKKKVDRYQAAESLADDLQRFLDGEPIHAKPPGRWRRVGHAINQHLVVATVSGTAATVLVLLTLLLLMSWIKANWQLNELRDQLLQERAVAATYLAAGKSNRTDGAFSVANYELNRLDRSIERLQEAGRHDTALQLAIAAAVQAQATGLPPTPRIQSTLESAVQAPAGQALTVDTETVDLEKGNLETMDYETLIAEAKKVARKPLTDFEVALYGLGPAEPVASNETP